MTLPTTTPAAILVAQREPLHIDEVTLPGTLEVGQVLVQVHYSGICGSQLGEIDGAKGPDPYLPHLLGHEGSGTVLALGAGVRHVAVGDRVVLHWRKGVGIEAQPPQYRWRGQPLNAGWVTTFNALAVVSENRLTPLAPDADLQLAALFGCAVTTGFGVVENNAGVRLGESVVVYGAGGVGLSVVQAAAMVGAWPVVAVDLHDHRLALARRLGATHVIHAGREDPAEAIRRIAAATAPRGSTGIDHFIDNTGLPRVIELGYALTGVRGRITLVGVPRKGDDVRLYSLPLHFGKRLAGSHGGESVPERDIPRFEALARAGRLSLRELVTEVHPLRDINLAIARMRSGETAGRCLIELPQVAGLPQGLTS